MYRVWGVLHQDITAATFSQTPLHKAEAAEAAALARVEVAQRGLVVTVTRNYYALVAAERKMRDRAAGGAAVSPVPRDCAAAGTARSGGAQ